MAMGRSSVEDPKLTEVKAILARLQRMSPDDEPEPTPPTSPIVLRPLPVSAGRMAEPSAMPLPLQPVSEPAPKRKTSPARLLTALLAGCATAALVLFETRSLWLPGPGTIATAIEVTPPPQVAVTIPVPPIVTVPTPPSAHDQAVTAPASAPAPPPAGAEVAVAPTVVAIPAPVVEAKVVEPLTDAAVMLLAEHLIKAGSVAAGRAELLRIAPRQSADVAWALARAFDPNVVGKIENADARPNADEAANWYRKWHALAVEQGLVADSVSIERIIRAMRQ